MAGVSGMFLSIPMMAVLKIMFDKSESLKQWGVLLGDNRPEGNVLGRMGFNMKRRLEEKRDEEVTKAEQDEKEKDTLRGSQPDSGS